MAKKKKNIPPSADSSLIMVNCLSCGTPISEVDLLAHVRLACENSVQAGRLALVDTTTNGKKKPYACGECLLKPASFVTQIALSQHKADKHPR